MLSKGCGLMKKKMITTIYVILFVAALCVVAFWFNPDLNIFKLKSVENNALEYIHQTYPKFTVDNISVRHEWKSNHYVVDYDNGAGDARTLIFDHTGEVVFVDEYIRDTAFRIIYDYENSIELKITEVLKKELDIDTHYLIVQDENARGKERDIALKGLDITNDVVTCSIGVTGDGNSSTIEFAELSKEIYIIVSSLGLPIEKMEIIQQNSTDSRFDIVCPVNMGEMSVEEIDKLIRK